MPHSKSGDKEQDQFQEFLEILKANEKDRNKPIQPSLYIVKRDALNASLSFYHGYDHPELDDVLETADEILDWLVKNSERTN